MGRARHLMVRHSGNKNRLDLLIAFVCLKLQQVDLMPRVDGVEPGFQLLTEALPRLRERVAPRFLRQFDQLACGGIDIASRRSFPCFPVLIVRGQALYQTGGGRGDYRGVQTVMQVAVLADLLHTPAAPEHGCDRAVHRLHRLFPVVGLRKGEVIPNQVIDGSCDVLCVLEVPVNKPGAFLLGQPPFQQLLPLAVIVDQIFHPHLVAVPARFVLSEILVGQAVPLLPVFAGQHQNLVLIAVVKAAAVWDDVIHIRIARLEQAGYVEVLAGIQAHAVLLPVQLELYDVQAGGVVSLIFRDLILCPLVGRAVIILTLFHLAALIEGPAHFTGQLDAHHIRRAVGADYRVDDLDGLGYRSADHRVRNLIHIR